MRFANAIAHDRLLLQPADELLATARAVRRDAIGGSWRACCVPTRLAAAVDGGGREAAGVAGGEPRHRPGRPPPASSRAPLLLLVSTSTLQGASVPPQLGVAEASLGVLAVRTPRLLHAPVASTRARVQWLATRASSLPPTRRPAPSALPPRCNQAASRDPGQVRRHRMWLLGLAWARRRRAAWSRRAIDPVAIARGAAAARPSSSTSLAAPRRPLRRATDAHVRPRQDADAPPRLLRGQRRRPRQGSSSRATPFTSRSAGASTAQRLRGRRPPPQLLPRRRDVRREHRAA